MSNWSELADLEQSFSVVAFSMQPGLANSQDCGCRSRWLLRQTSLRRPPDWLKDNSAQQ